MAVLLESALSGGYIFESRDGTFSDLSSVHGSYKRVIKTVEAILLIGHELKAAKVRQVKWYFDKPVSNSGQLKTLLLSISHQYQFNWEVELVYNPDKMLVQQQGIIISSDSWVLDNAKKWYNLAATLIRKHINHPMIISVNDHP